MTHLVERHINVVAAAFPLSSDVIVVWLTKVWPKCSIFVAMNRKIQNSTIMMPQQPQCIKIVEFSFCSNINWGYLLLTELYTTNRALQYQNQHLLTFLSVVGEYYVQSQNSHLNCQFCITAQHYINPTNWNTLSNTTKVTLQLLHRCRSPVTSLHSDMITYLPNAVSKDYGPRQNLNSLIDKSLHQNHHFDLLHSRLWCIAINFNGTFSVTTQLHITQPK